MTLIKILLVSDEIPSKALREDARSDENNAFMSEDSIEIRRANKGVEKKQQSIIPYSNQNT